jgi:hypothetical protein
VGTAGVVLVGFRHQRRAPASELENDGFELLTARGEPEEGGRDRRWRFLAGDDSFPFEVAKALGEQVGGDTRQAVMEVGVPARRLQEQLAHDEEVPAVADHVECLGDRAVLLVGAHCSSIAQPNLGINTYILTF